MNLGTEIASHDTWDKSLKWTVENILQTFSHPNIIFVTISPETFSYTGGYKLNIYCCPSSQHMVIFILKPNCTRYIKISLILYHKLS